MRRAQGKKVIKIVLTSMSRRDWMAEGRFTSSIGGKPRRNTSERVKSRAWDKDWGLWRRGQGMIRTRDETTWSGNNDLRHTREPITNCHGCSWRVARVGRTAGPGKKRPGRALGAYVYKSTKDC